MSSMIIKEDINNIVEEIKSYSELDNSTVCITGATGLIGSMIVKSILELNCKYNKNVKVLAIARNKEKTEKVFGDYIKSEQLEVLYQDINDRISYENKVDYVIHGASVTDSKSFVEKPVETILTAINGSKNVLDFAKNNNVNSMVYLSSLEVYGVTDFELESVKEDMSGYIDVLNVRSSYSESKRMVENLCCSYYEEYNVPVKIARLCQTLGAGVDYNDNRVFAQFSRCIIENKDIVLKTKGETTRNYCYLPDAIRAIFMILFKGNNKEAYNVANENSTISIKNMAEMLVAEYDNKIKVVFDIADDATKLGYNPIIKIKLDTEKICNLGWKPTTNIKDMFVRMINDMKENMISISKSS